jgi:membrane-associated phospholipid phosphatase
MIGAPMLRAGLPAELFSRYWHTWLPYALAAVLLAVLGVLAGLGAGGVRRVAPARMFGLAAAALAVLGVAVAILADAAAEGDGLTVFDRPTWQWFIEHRSAFATGVAKIVTSVGSTLVMGMLACAVAVVLFLRHRRGDAVMVAVVAAGGGLIIFFGKRVVGRVRPPEQYRLVVETNQSFPSGHALESMAVIGVMMILIVAATRSLATRSFVVSGAALVVAAVGVSRLYLGVHWATDVLEGWLSGAGWLLVCVTTRRLWRSYRDNREHGSPTGTDPGTTDPEDDPAVTHQPRL